MRNVYELGFDFTKLKPVKEEGGRIIVKGIVRSDFEQIIQTDMTNEMEHCKVWEVVAISDTVKQVAKGDKVLVLKAALDKVDKDAPRIGIVDIIDVAAVVLD